MGDDLTRAFAKKSTVIAPMYLTININAFLKINTQVYFYNPAYAVKRNACKQALLTREIVSLLLRSLQAESGYMQQFGPPGSLRTVKTICS